MSVAALKPRNAVESLRDVVQDLLVPELKALKAEMNALSMKMDLLHGQTMQAIKNVEDNISLRERLSVLEDRIKRN